MDTPEKIMARADVLRARFLGYAELAQSEGLDEEAWHFVVLASRPRLLAQRLIAALPEVEVIL